MDELALRQLNGGDDEDDALRRALALSMDDAGVAGEVSEHQSDENEEKDEVEPDEVGTTGAATGAAISNRPRGHVRSASTATTASAASSSPPPASPRQAMTEDRPERGKGKQKESVLTVAASAAASADDGNPVATPSVAGPPLSLLSLDRKAMEAERLARRQKLLEAQQAQNAPKSRPEEKREIDVQETWRQKEQLKQSWKLQQPRQPTPQKRKARDDDIIVIDDDDDDNDADDDDNNNSNNNDTKGKNDRKTIQKLQSSHKAPAARRRKLDESKEEGGGDKIATHVPPPSSSRLGNDARGSEAGGKGATGSSSSAHLPPSDRLPYAKGVVKRTWVRGQPRRDDDVTIEEIWQKQDLELAVLSSFQWDESWMMTRLDVRRTRVLLIAYATDEHQKEEIKANVPSGSKIRFCFPPMQTMGFMHSKLQLLKFPAHLRLVVPTGNLTPYDWGETGVLENMVFLIDLPRLPRGTRVEGAGTPFMEDLSYFLAAQGVEESMVQSLRNYDFSETGRYAFVHSMAGSHMDESWKRTGYSGLGRAVNAMGWASSKPIQLDYICSSIGSANDDLLNALYYACQGDSGLKEFEARTSKPRGGKGKLVAAATSVAPASQTGPRNCLRLYFPSQETIDDSLGGRNCAGTICFQKKWWDAPTFPHAILRDAQNVRKGILLHAKLLLVRTGSGAAEKRPGQAARPRGWAYLGSANMSESAWGRIVKDRASGKTKITCRNWECGVLIPAAPAEEEGAGEEDEDEVDADAGEQVVSPSMGEDATMLDVFHDTLPVPITVPGAKYSSDSALGEKRRPWFFLEG